MSLSLTTREEIKNLCFANRKGALLSAGAALSWFSDAMTLLTTYLPEILDVLKGVLATTGSSATVAQFFAAGNEIFNPASVPSVGGGSVPEEG